jgi:hypothetical protein
MDLQLQQELEALKTSCTEVRASMDRTSSLLDEVFELAKAADAGPALEKLALFRHELDLVADRCRATEQAASRSLRGAVRRREIES